MTYDDIFAGPADSTPLEEEEEQANILIATVWLDHSRVKIAGLLTTKHLQLIHKRMFNRVWSWAGKFRQSNKNIGIPWSQISINLDSLCKNTVAQIADVSTSRWTRDEIAIRFHHRLVQIHPFVNGNGRHARLVTDKLLSLLDEKEFTWGGSSIEDDGNARGEYVRALRQADEHDFVALLRFARS